MGRKINYKSDFVLRERFRNGSGALVALPDVDFTLRYWVKAGRVYKAARRGDNYINCKPDGDALLVIFKDHDLGEGTLKHELHLNLDNALMPDGVQSVYYLDNTNVELWQRSGTQEGVVESELIAAYTRGFRFVWEDFTPDNIIELQRPATEAAERAETAVADFIRDAQAASDTAVENAETATANAEEATRNAEAATDAANTAAQEAQTAKRNADTATRNANTATENANRAKEEAEAATEESEEATRESKDATGKAKTATTNAQTATGYANAAAQQAAAEAERLAQTRAQLQELIERAEAATREIPTGLKVEAPERITIGNPTPQYVRARVKPDTALQNVLFLGDCTAAVGVDPDGRLRPRRAGRGSVHVIPTAGTRYYKTVTVEAVEPSIRLSGGAMRLDKNGNIRLT